MDDGDKGAALESTRPIDNPLALAILALLTERPMHPYEMVSLLRQRHKHETVRLRYSSLYSVVASLQRAGLIEALEITRAGRRPERTLYGLTSAGRAELDGWLVDLLRRPVKEYPRFAAGLTFATRLPAADVATLLEVRGESLDEAIVSARADLDEARAAGLGRAQLIEFEYGLILLEAERQWVRDLARDLRAGTIDWPDRAI